MQKLRKIIFWCHLPVGVIAGLVILNMCVTGVLLAYEKQITSWADTRSYRSGPPTPGGAFLVVTGLALAIRRLRAWIAKRARSRKPRLGEISQPVLDSAGD